MGTNTSYRAIVEDVIRKYARLRPSHGQIRLDTVFDEQQDRYALMQVGWDQGVRVRGNLIYITLHDDKVYIEYDGIERGITDELVKRGIPPEKIVLVFLAPANQSLLVPA
ncbi:MAG: XisI protein [Caldilineaceae bacterium]